MTPEGLNSEDAYQANYRKTRIAYWDALARKMDVWTDHSKSAQFKRKMGFVIRKEMKTTPSQHAPH